MKETMYLIDEQDIFDTATGIMYCYRMTGRPYSLTIAEAEKEGKLWPELRIDSVNGGADNTYLFEKDAATLFWERLKERAIKC